MASPDIVAITWFEHRRTRTLCARLGWEYLLLKTRRRGLLRYLLLAPRTVLQLAHRRPSVLVVQNPSLVLTALCVAIRPLFRFALVVDAHNEAVQPFVFKNAPMLWLSRLCLRRADATIVTNDELATYVARYGGSPLVLPDALPIPGKTGSATRAASGFDIVIIATFSPDEPIEEIFAAATKFGGEVRFLVTGDRDRLPRSSFRHVPSNVTFTGFLPETEYWGLLRRCDIVVDLTRMPNCLVCGAYEAVAVMKPMILTESAGARRWFGDAAIYIQNSSDAIEQALRAMMSDIEDWNRRATRALKRIETAWQERCDFMESALCRLTRDSHKP